MRHTEADTGILLADIVTLVVCEEHVGGETSLGRVRVCEGGQLGFVVRIEEGAHPSSSSRHREISWWQLPWP